jgi:hypothetical protein
MEKIVASFLAVIAIAFIAPLAGVLIGSFTGWVVGLVFSETILSFLSRFGVDTAGLAVWQIGAAMGFLGSFLRTTVSKT